MKFGVLLAVGAAMASIWGGAAMAADAIPYPDAGTYNATSYTFTAATTGDLIGYFAGSGASYDNEVGVLDNGLLTSGGFGLDNHASSIGQSFDFGHVNAGDTLTFVLQNNTLGKDAYSNPLLNVAYDEPTDTIGHNHVYSTAYTATGPVLGSIPPGTYVAFEDLPFPDSDFNYSDETFVFASTTVTPVSGAPEPSAWALMIGGVALAGGALRAHRRRGWATLAA